MLVYCAYCGKQIDTDRQKYYSPSIWSSDTNYYCDMYNCYSKYKDKLQKERFEEKLKSSPPTSSGATTYIPTQFPVYKEQKFTDGSRYVGEFVNGKRHGKGTNYFPNGARYDGEWKNGYMNGYGVCVYANGGKYEGAWADGKRNGQGTHFYADGAKYVGNWVNDELHGQGTYFYAKGEKYVGEWANDKKQGKGTYYYVNPTATYDGDWYNNLRHGYGVEEIHAPQGTQRYEGEWKENKRCGKGKIRFVDGVVKEGYFENGKFIGTVAPVSQIDGEEMDISPEMLAQFKNGENFATGNPTPTKEADQEIWDKLEKMESSQKKDEFLASHPVIVVPKGTKRIPPYMFDKCLNLKGVIFNNDLTEIHMWAFRDCKNLSSDLSFPKGIKKINGSSFEGCSSLKKIILPNNVIIEGKAFMDCGISEVEFETEPPRGVSIRYGAFKNCDKHMVKEMKKKIKNIGANAFK